MNAPLSLHKSLFKEDLSKIIFGEVQPANQVIAADARDLEEIVFGYVPTDFRSVSALLPITELESVRAEMKAVAIAYFHKHLKYINECKRVRSHNALSKRLKAENRPHKPVQKLPDIVPPMLFNTTFGSGKGYLIIQEIVLLCLLHDVPLVVTAPHHKLCDEHVKNNKGMAHYQGRVDAFDEEKSKKFPDHTCFKLSKTEDASGKHHPVANSFCDKCENGHAGALCKYKKGSEQYIKTIEWFEKNNCKPEDYEGKDCKFMYVGLPNQLAQKIIAAPTASFSPALGMHRGNSVKEASTEDKARAYRDKAELQVTTEYDEGTQRLVIIDEATQIDEEVTISISDINDFWINSITSLIKTLNPETDKVLIELLSSVKTAFSDLIVAITKRTEIDKDTILKLQEQIAIMKLSTGGAARWEKITRDKTTGEYYMPLRALNTLANNLTNNTVRRDAEKHCIYVSDVKPVIRWAMEHGSVIFLDATAPFEMKALIEKAGGLIFQRNVEQNMQVIFVDSHDHEYFRGRVPKNGEDKNTWKGDPETLRIIIDCYRATAKRYYRELIEIAKQMSTTGEGQAIICHMAYLKYACDDYENENAAQIMADQFYDETGCKIGWYGKHDRGQNDWKGFNLALVGMPILGSDHIASAYGGVRACLAEFGIDWPEWNGKMDIEDEPKFEIDENGNKVKIKIKKGERHIARAEKKNRPNNGVPLPVQPFIREWLVDRYAATHAQALGRARAVNMEDLIYTQIFGGLQTDEMRTALLRHGIEIHGTMPNTIHVGQRWMDDIEIVQLAVEHLKANYINCSFSRDEVRSVLPELDLHPANQQIRNEDINKALAFIRSIDPTLPEPSKGGRPAKDKPKMQRKTVA